MRRFFAADIDSGSRMAVLRGDELKHLKNSLRLGTGAEVIVINGRGFEFAGIVENVTDTSAIIRIFDVTECIRSSPLKVKLVQAMPKGSKPEFIIQKATELGVRKLVFYFSERTVPVLDKEAREKKRKRYERIAIEAVKQCGRGWLPVISFKEFNEAIGASSSKLKLALYERESEVDRKRVPIKAALKGYDKSDGIALLLGPEGGFTEEEISLAERAGYMPVGIGPRILRSETAAIAALSIVQYELGDMG
ncbi:MAG: 16S rRNA (uracil(1498)-N(3))-methyltransferase [Deltaproteobacteria bacterium]|nr:16S rRNA (uracil(1498)-N(3))-methyltransferase [Deltaproteobacteria bacterium]